MTPKLQILLEVSAWPVCLGESSSLFLDPARQRELDLGVVHLCDQGTAALPSFNNLTPSNTKCTNIPRHNYYLPNNLDGVGSGSVPSSHVPVALGDGGGDSEVPVFAVHVEFQTWSRTSARYRSS